MSTLAVVPIFMSAGAAVLPTVLAAVTSVLAVLLKPRELARLCRQRPAMMGSVLAGMVLAIGGVTFWIMSPPKAAAARATGPAQTDWAQVAETIIEQQQFHSASAPAGTQQASTAVAQGTTTTRSATSAVLSGTQTPQDFTRTLYAGGSSPVKMAPMWSYKPAGTLFLAVPAVTQAGRMFVAGAQSDLGGYTGLLSCVDMQTGQAVWEIGDLNGEFLKAFFSSPAVTPDGKWVIVGQGLHNDTDCSLICVDALTGKKKWAVSTPLHLESSPAIFGDIAVVGAGAIEGTDGRPTGNPGYVFAVRISDGKELWRQPVNDPESSPAIDAEGNVYIGSGFNGNAVVAMRSDPDEVLKEKKLERLMWKAPAAYPMTSPITIAGEMVLAAGGNSDVVHSNRNARGQVMALDRKTGKVLWQVTTEDSILGSLAVRDNLVIAPCRTGEVLALSLKDGSVVWRSRISGNAPVVGGCAFTPEHVYALSNDGYLAVLDPKAGAVQAKVYVNDKSQPGSGLSVSSPVVANGRVYIGTETGGLRCLAELPENGGARP